MSARYSNRKVVLTLLLPMSCGAHVKRGPVGTLDDAGVFREPDGEVLFSPGSACKVFNHAALAAPPMCSDLNDAGTHNLPDNINPICDEWTKEVSPGFAIGARCGGRCGAEEVGLQILDSADMTISRHIIDDRVRCTPGEDGDRYCSALFGQFVNGPARVLAYCRQVCDWLPQPNPKPNCYRGPQCSEGDCQSFAAYACVTDERQCDLHAAMGIKGLTPPYPFVCVNRGNDWTLETICSPPP